MDVKRLKQEHAEMLAFLNNEKNQPQVQQQMGSQPGHGGQMMQFNICRLESSMSMKSRNYGVGGVPGQSFEYLI